MGVNYNGTPRLIKKAGDVFTHRDLETGNKAIENFVLADKLVFDFLPVNDLCSMDKFEFKIIGTRWNNANWIENKNFAVYEKTLGEIFYLDPQ